MSKRIGSRVYDPEKSEMICEIDGGKIYRKRSHGREWFTVFDDGAIRPLDENNSKDRELIEIGLQNVHETKPSRTTVWVDRETYELLSKYADKNRMNISEALAIIVRRVIDLDGIS